MGKYVKVYKGYNADRFRKLYDDWKKKSGSNDDVLADLLGITRKTLTEYKKGREIKHMKIMASVCDFFNVNLDYFYTIEEEPIYMEDYAARSRVDHFPEFVEEMKDIWRRYFGPIVEEYQEEYGTRIKVLRMCKLGREYIIPENKFRRVCFYLQNDFEDHIAMVGDVVAIYAGDGPNEKYEGIYNSILPPTSTDPEKQAKNSKEELKKYIEGLF